MTVEIMFNVVGECTQEIDIINPEYDDERICRELNEGMLATTTWHRSGESMEIVVVSTGEAVARIVSQEIDGEYNYFEPANDVMFFRSLEDDDG